jgi:diguanylate cyclase (GGDEF)-like protein
MPIVTESHRAASPRHRTNRTAQPADRCAEAEQMWRRGFVCEPPARRVNRAQVPRPAADGGYVDAAEVMRLVAAAQEGAADETRRAAEARMVELAGSIEAGPAGLHFVRTVAWRAAGRYHEAWAASSLMLAAAERDGDPGWRAIALTMRAGQRIMLGDSDLVEWDIDTVLRDLTGAEAALASGVTDPLVGSNAHIGIANGYFDLRLYELADPHYQAAYDLVSEAGAAGAVPAICQANLAELHLTWALELYRVGHVSEAEKHSLIAESHALRAAEDAPAGNAYRRSLAHLLAGCARADGDDPAGAAALIRAHAETVRASREDWWRFSMPFLAVALDRSGHREEALAVIERAVADLPAEAESYNVAALTHTHAVLLAKTGGPELRAVLRYGDGLAGALWRQRQRTLHSAETLRSYQRLRDEHERVSRTADTDPLTGIANRRAFDRELDHRAEGGSGGTAVLVIDLDKFKPLNDTHGHAAGDQALKAIAAALSGQIRTGDLLARTGGDEFCALLDGADGAAATQVAERMVHAVRALDIAVTTSIGIAAGPGTAVHDTLDRADHAMYTAKAAGGDQTHAAPDPRDDPGSHQRDFPRG